MDKTLSEPYLRDLEFRGFVQGLTYLDTDSNPVCHYFGGVPYALPPVGAFRWQKPRSLAPCYRYGSQAHPGVYTGNCSLCPQPGFNDGLETSEWDEDCLQVNIWVPVGEPPGGGWPVLFWIHGGFLQFGSPRDINLKAMLSESSTKAIVVTPAYRLNILGYLSSPELASSCRDFSSNLGFWDQRLALEWTWQNVSYFGGNASNITVGGYSAGSHSVFHQLAYDLGLPDSKSIIKRVLMLSNGPGMQPKSLSEAQEQFNELLHVLKIPLSLSPSEKLTRLRALDAKTLIQATTSMKYHQFRGVSDNLFIRTTLFQEIDNGTFAQKLKARNIALIIGECSDEHFVYGTWRPPQNSLQSMIHRLQADYSAPAVEALVKYYYPNQKLPPGCKDWPSAFGKLYADIQIHALERGFVAPLYRHGAGHLVHRYRIEWRAQCCDKKWPKTWGVTHGTDMALWFWGDGERLNGKEKSVVKGAFHENLGTFLRGEKMEWGTQHPLHVRRLKADGTVVCERDEGLEEGVRVWDLLNRVGVTRMVGGAKL